MGRQTTATVMMGGIRPEPESEKDEIPSLVPYFGRKGWRHSTSDAGTQMDTSASIFTRCRTCGGPSPLATVFHAMYISIAAIVTGAVVFLLLTDNFAVIPGFDTDDVVKTVSVASFQAAGYVAIAVFLVKSPTRWWMLLYGGVMVLTYLAAAVWWWVFFAKDSVLGEVLVDLCDCPVEDEGIMTWKFIQTVSDAQKQQPAPLCFFTSPPSSIDLERPGYFLRSDSAVDTLIRYDTIRTTVMTTEDAAGQRPRAVLTNPEALTNPSAADEANALRPPPLDRDEDLLEEFPPDSEDVDLVHCRIATIPSLGLEKLTAAQRLCLRQNEIQKIEGLECLAATLQELDLYDNGIGHMARLEALVNLTNLDLSYNAIKHVKGIETLVKLRNLYLASNRITVIEGLDTLVDLMNLELGANRIREIQNLDALKNLEELWLGKNKITEIKNISSLSNLRILSLPSNRLIKFTGLDGLTSLEELYVSHNAITSLDGLQNTPNIKILDVTHNELTSIKGIEHLSQLAEFWASENQISSFQEVEEVLKDKAELETVYFEMNPLQTAAPATYRNKVRLALPQIKQIDATYVTSNV
ncbi:Internalin-A [Drechslerella dactyloides]|uniref:Internalin-A n=1 Tax=Drechslerella dactyloides TaxID=74499 RepID=A0AAD6NMV0_DREDA|nr:Internalin-A [Drechslerella dactyloides]